MKKCLRDIFSFTNPASFKIDSTSDFLNNLSEGSSEEWDFDVESACDTGETKAVKNAVKMVLELILRTRKECSSASTSTKKRRS